MTCGNPVFSRRFTSVREVAEPWINIPSAVFLPIISDNSWHAWSLSVTPKKLNYIYFDE